MKRVKLKDGSLSFDNPDEWDAGESETVQLSVYVAPDQGIISLKDELTDNDIEKRVVNKIISSALPKI